MQTKIIFVLLILKCCKAFLLPGSTARGWLSVHPRTGLSSSPSLPLSSAPQRVSPPLNLFASSTTSHQSHSLPIQLVRPGNEFLAAVDPFWSWNKRNTGVEEKWKAHLGTWTHFNSTGLAMHPPQPWTSGRVRKGLRRSDPEDSQFELWSCFESNARGSFASHTPREVDPHWDLRYNFVKNPWRISRLKSIAPEKWHGPWPEESDVLRVTVVKPDACTVSFVPYLPPLESVQNAIRSGIACAHTFSCELWLAEEVNGVKEAIKSGIFMSYDVVSGELKQLIQLRELSLSEPEDLVGARMCMPRFAASQAVFGALDPSSPVNFDLLSQAVGQLNATSNSPLFSSHALDLEAGRPIQDIIADAGWTAESRTHQLTAGPMSSEVAWVCSNLRPDSYYGPAHSDPRYMHLRLKDGMFATLPRSLSAFDSEVLLELGCLRAQSEGFQRVVVLGDRRTGGFSTLCHEVWSPPELLGA